MHVIKTTAQEAVQQAHTSPRTGSNTRMAGTVPHYNTTTPAQDISPGRPADFANQLRAGPQAGKQKQAENESFGLESIVDAVNPLHHLPVVGTIYREVTGDELGSIARVAGGALYGGAAGAALGAGNAVLEFASGDDIAGHAMAMLGEGGAPSPASSHRSGTSPEARMENVIAAYGDQAAQIQGASQTYEAARVDDSSPAHIRQSSYNG
jgi:hypothetical protein